MKDINLDDYESIFDAVCDYNAKTIRKPNILEALDFPLHYTYFRVQDLKEITLNIKNNEEKELIVSKHSKDYNRVFVIRKTDDVITYLLKNINTTDPDIKVLYKFSLDEVPESYLDMYASILWEIKNYKNN